MEHEFINAMRQFVAGIKTYMSYTSLNIIGKQHTLSHNLSKNLKLGGMLKDQIPFDQPKLGTF